MKTYTSIFNPDGSSYKRLTFSSYEAHFHAREFGEPSKICISPDREFAALVFNIGDPVRYVAPSALRGEIGQNEFNLLYLPRLSPCELYPGETFLTISLHFRPKLLHKLMGLFPALEDFAKQMKKKIPAQQADAPPCPGWKIQELIHELVDGIEEGVEAMGDDYEDQKFYTDIDAHPEERDKLDKVIKLGLYQLAHAGDPIAGPDQKTEKEMDRILDEADESIAARLARIADVSEATFRKVVMEEYGSTIEDIFEDVRLQKACTMLFSTKMSVLQIADAVGFTYRELIDVFRRKAGCTPEEFRNFLTGKKM